VKVLEELSDLRQYLYSLDKEMGTPRSIPDGRKDCLYLCKYECIRRCVRTYVYGF